MESASNRKVVFGLNVLINYNMKRMHYYFNNVHGSKDFDLMLMFNRCASQSRNCNLIFYRWLADNCAGFLPPKMNSLTHSWEQLIQRFRGDERSAVLNKCESLEREGLKIFRVALALSFLPPSLHDEVHKHINRMDEALRTFVMLRDHKTEEVQLADLQGWL